MSTQSTTQRLKLDTAVLQQQQLNAIEDPENSEIEMTHGNVDADYEFPAHEQHLMHVRLTKEVHLPDLKKYRTDSKVWTGSPALYKRMSGSVAEGGNATFADYDSQTLLHDVLLGAQSAARTTSTTPAPAGGEDAKKPLRIKADYVARYEELAAVAPNLTEDLRKAPADATVDELKKAIADLEAGAGN